MPQRSDWRALAAGVLLVLGAATGGPWTSELPPALAQARTTQRDVLVLYDGSDWCPPAARFRQEVLDTPVVRTWLEARYVLVRWDEPNALDAEAAQLARKRSEALHFTVRDYPAVLLLDPQSRLYGHLPCAGETAAGFLVRLKQARDRRNARDAAWALAEHATGAERALRLGQGLAALEDEVARANRETLDQLRHADPRDTSGYQRRYTFSLLAFLEGKVLAPAEAKRYEEAEQALEEQLANDKWTPTQRQELLAARFALYSRWPAKHAAAPAVLEQLIAVAPNSDLAAGARGYRAYLAGRVAVTNRWDPSLCRDPGTWVRDVSAEVTTPGTYTVTFVHVSGQPLGIDEVTLRAGDTVVASDRHHGEAAATPKANVYTFTLQSVPREPLTLAMVTRCGGWRESYGEIRVEKR